MRQMLTSIFLLLSFALIGQKNIHEQWTNALKTFVDKDGNVNYAKWKNENPPAEYWSKNDSLAYFINAYNAVTVKLILDNYPLKSIRKLITPWRFKRFNLDGKKVSPTHIEHEILRKMEEPRIHFAINCASVSCPKLLNKAFYSHSMEKQLEAVTTDFINDEKRNILSVKEMEISRIFQWFAGDFGSKKERHAFIRKYAKQPVAKNAKVRFLNYDWGLNE